MSASELVHSEGSECTAGRSANAERCKRWRARRRAGMRVARVRVSTNEVRRLAAAGYLSGGEQATCQQLDQAIEAFMADHLP